MSVSGRFSLSFDTLARYLFNEEFLERNPVFQSIKETLDQCKATYKQQLEEAGCSCRMNSEWAAPCIEKTMAILEDAKTNDHETVRQFVRFIGHKDDNADVDGLGVNIVVGDKRYDIHIVKTPATQGA